MEGDGEGTLLLSCCRGMSPCHCRNVGEDEGEGGRGALSSSGRVCQRSLLCVVVASWSSHMKEEGEEGEDETWARHCRRCRSI